MGRPHRLDEFGMGGQPGAIVVEGHRAHLADPRVGAQRTDQVQLDDLLNHPDTGRGGERLHHVEAVTDVEPVGAERGQHAQSEGLGEVRNALDLKQAAAIEDEVAVVEQQAATEPAGGRRRGHEASRVDWLTEVMVNGVAGLPLVVPVTVAKTAGEPPSRSVVDSPESTETTAW